MPRAKTATATQAGRNVARKTAREDFDRWLRTHEIEALATTPATLEEKAAGAAAAAFGMDAVPQRTFEAWVRGFKKAYPKALAKEVRRFMPAKVASKMDLFCRFMDAIRANTLPEMETLIVSRLGVRTSPWDMTPRPIRKPKPPPLRGDNPQVPRYRRELAKLARRHAKADWKVYLESADLAAIPLTSEERRLRMSQALADLTTRAPWKRWSRSEDFDIAFPIDYDWLYLEELMKVVRKWVRSPAVLKEPEAACSLYTALTS